MALANANFDDLSERDLLDHIASGMPEGLLIDYKSAPYGSTDGDKREFLKDVSSFANAAGGHLIIGIEENAGTPTRIAPLTIDTDQELQRLENLARDGIEPRLVGLRMKAVPITGGGSVIVVRILKSFNPPHRVRAQNSNRIYGRNSAGAYEFSVEELRVVFTSGASAFDRIRAFKAERLAKIDSGEAIVPLKEYLGRLVIHLVPMSAFGLANQIDLERASALAASLRPLESPHGYSPRINFDGFSAVSHAFDGESWSYTQLFRNGAIEAVKVRVKTDRTRGGFIIPSVALGTWIFEVLPGYLSALRSLDVAPPVVLMITLQGVRSSRLGIIPEPLDDPPLIDRDVLELPEIMIDRYGTDEDYQRACRPAFDALWNSAGYPRSYHFDETGRWNPPKRGT